MRPNGANQGPPSTSGALSVDVVDGGKGWAIDVALMGWG
jgi:hypothetical protein